MSNERCLVSIHSEAGFAACPGPRRRRAGRDLRHSAPRRSGAARKLLSNAGVTRVSLDHGVPVANAILTVENEAQAWARADDKGRDAARVAVEMANLMEALS